MTLPAPSAPFVMHGAREAFVAGLAHIGEQVRSIEEAVAENPALAFGLARTLVETVCRTIHAERKVAYSEDDDLPRLFRTASSHLPFLPPTASDAVEVRRSLVRTLLPPTASGEAGVRRSLTKTINGLSTAIQGICELRNRCGFASHGSDKPRPAMEAVQALMAAEAADTIVGFLHRVHRQDRTPSPSPQALYDDNAAFNDSIDESFGPIRIFDVEFRASEVLFQMEPDSYRIYLAEFDEEEASAGDGEGTMLEVTP